MGQTRYAPLLPQALWFGSAWFGSVPTLWNRGATKRSEAGIEAQQKASDLPETAPREERVSNN